MSKKLLLLTMAKCISFFVVMILTGSKIHAQEFESAIYTQYVGEVTSSFLKEIYKEYGFECGASKRTRTVYVLHSL